jgi:hypothetical protein
MGGLSDLPDMPDPPDVGVWQGVTDLGWRVHVAGWHRGGLSDLSDLSGLSGLSGTAHAAG